MPDNFAISFDDILSAAKRLEGHAVRTPLLEFAPLNDKLGKRVLVKFEGAQHTGSFKFRGAFNRISTIDPSAKAAGVVAWSSGNHAQGIAAAASMNDIRGNHRHAQRRAQNQGQQHPRPWRRYRLL